MLLSILIPTYNRCSFFLKNLYILRECILGSSMSKDVEIIISNNCSTDKTDEAVTEFQSKRLDVHCNYFLQSKNIGLEKNALFVLSKAKGMYVMYVGDDDYIDYEYF